MSAYAPRGTVMLAYIWPYSSNLERSIRVLPDRRTLPYIPAWQCRAVTLPTLHDTRLQSLTPPCESSRPFTRLSLLVQITTLHTTPLAGRLPTLTPLVAQLVLLLFAYENALLEEVVKHVGHSLILLFRGTMMPANSTGMKLPLAAPVLPAAQLSEDERPRLDILVSS